MRKLIARCWERLPAEFRVLHRQFLLRVVDLEALSIEADIPRFLGQFAGVLMMISLVHLLGALMFPPPPSMAWGVEQSRVSDMMLVIGLLSVITWDSTLPDRRDVVVLGPLPIHPRMILMAKVAAAAALIGLAILCLNFASSLGSSLLFGGMRGTPGIARFFASYWVTIVAASVFLWGAVLTIQGFSALMLSRRVFLVVSSILQLAAFATFMAGYFLVPSLNTLAEFTSPGNHVLLAWCPIFWFFALLNQLNGSLPPELTWLAERAWIALGMVWMGASSSLLLSYLRTMKKTMEEPDLVPGAGSRNWIPAMGRGLHAAIVTFCLRSLMRSRQHRVALAFFLSIVFAMALVWLRREIMAPAREPVPSGFLIATILMMSLTVLGLRAVFSLPISLNANWVLRVTQLRPTGEYFAATRWCLLLFAVIPSTLLAALLSLRFAPWHAVAAHLAMLTLFGCVFVEIGLFRFDKVPFTCSYLPGKANIQVIFWGFAFVWLIVGISSGAYEYGALRDLGKYATMAGVLLSILLGLGILNRYRARTAVLYFEEVAPEVITRLGLIFVPPVESTSEELSAD